MARTQGLQVIDRSTVRRLDASVSYGTGLEAILCLLILNGETPFESFERGADFARAVRRGLPAAVGGAMKRLHTPRGDPWSCLLARMAAEEPPHDVAVMLDRLENIAPADLKLTMLGFDRLGGADSAPLYRRAAADDAVAVAALRRLALDEGRQAEVEPLLRTAAFDLHQLVTAALKDLPAEMFGGAGAAELLERDANDVTRLLADSRDSEAVIERLTRGLMYKPEPGVVGVVLVPSLVHRPWTLVLDHGRRKIFCYPGRLDAELSAPDLGLIAIYRALGDGTRLRILRRLATGQASVAQISEQLGLAKSTVHEHLLSLREAGLVRLPASGGFELVPELPDLNWMLKEFLGLEMRGQCETCGVQVEADGVAYICSYECTFCDSCAEVHNHVCPNCAGELVQRPRRVKQTRPRHPAGRGHRVPTARRSG